MRQLALAVFVSALGGLALETTAVARIDAAQSGGTITGMVLARERPDNEDSLLIGIDGQGGAMFDEFRIELPERWSFTLGFRTDGWDFRQDGRRLIGSGESSARVRLRFDTAFTGSDRLVTRLLDRTVDFEVYLQGRKLFDSKLPVTVTDPVQVRDVIDWELQIPRYVSQGEDFYASASSPYNRGRWQLGMGGNFEDLVPVKPGAPAFFSDAPGATPSDDVTFFEVRHDFKGTLGGPRLTARFFDEWGEKVVDAPLDTIFGSTPIDQLCAPSISGGGAHAFAGQGACVSGCFPRESWGALTLDGVLALQLRAASRRTLILGIPDSVQPGQHSIQFGGGFGQGSGLFTFRVLGVAGSIDQNLLWRGELTTMRLQVLGTEESLPLEIVNRTPGIITVEGGERQVVNSAGGTSNMLTRSVRGIRKGDFAIDYRLTDVSCGLNGPMRK